MKHQFIALTIALFLATSAHSQVDFGVKVGLGTSFTDFDTTSSDIKDGNAEFGYSIGAFTRFGSKKFKLMPELLYTNTKTSVKLNNLTTSEILTNKLDRIDIPLSVVLKPLPLINVSGGLIGSYIMSSDESIKDNTTEALKNYKDFTVGYQFGGGVEIANLIIDLQFERSLNSILNNDQIAGFAVDERISMVKGNVAFKLF